MPDHCKPGGAGASYRYTPSSSGYNASFVLAVGHPSPDFYSYCPGVECENAVLPELGADGTPDFGDFNAIKAASRNHNGPYVACELLYTCPEVFKWWYKDVPGINRRVDKTMRFEKIGPTKYHYKSNDFWPINADGYGSAGSTNDGINGEFTSHFQTYFKYSGGETLTFTGDDDVWVFFNGRLGVDVGGIHGTWSKDITLEKGMAASKLHMYPGGIYAIDMFHAERCRGGSNYEMTLDGFISMGKSTCDSVCGDGIIRGDEECDYVTSDLNNVDEQHANGCNHCRLAPHCGNGKIESGEGCDSTESWCVGCKIDTCGNGVFDSEHEQCDPTAPASDVNKVDQCLNTCRISGCGDGFVDAAHGEECDDGNTSNDNMCTTQCKAPICGDGIVSPSLCRF